MSRGLTTEVDTGRTVFHLEPVIRQAELPALLQQASDTLRDSSGPVEIDFTAIHERHHNAVAAALAVRQMALEVNRQVTLTNADDSLQRHIDRLTQDAVHAESSASIYSFPRHIGGMIADLLGDIRIMLGFVGELVAAFGVAAIHPRKIRWNDLIKTMDRTGTDAVPIVITICFLMGLILGFQAAVQMHAYGADIFVANLVGLSICKELGPLMVAMICTGRAGSAFAAEIGTMKVSEEIDALTTMGVAPGRFLVVPRVVALVAVMPLLTIIGDIAGVAGGFVVGIVHLDLPFIVYWNQTVKAVSHYHVLEGLIKSVVFGFLIAAVGCLRGLRTENGAEGVGAGTTSAVVTGIFLIVIADSLLTFLFSTIGFAL